MTTPPHRRIPLSVLDLAIVPSGSTGAAAVRAAVERAVDLDRLGYHRVWYAEHHLSPGVASASPAVLAALTAGRTDRIRVGSGAVLLSTTSPLIAAEQFGAIAALHPGRVDLGLGRAFTPPPTPAPGSPAPAPAKPPARDRVVDGLPVPAPAPLDFSDSALRERLLAQQDVVGAGRAPGDFATELELVLALQRGRYRDAHGTDYTAPPVQDAAFELWVLASSGGESARVAGALGLPLTANYHVAPHSVLDTVRTYRESFRPGVLDEPYVVVSADVLAAETDARAEELAAPYAEWVLSIRQGASGAITYPHPDEARTGALLSEREQALVRDRLLSRVVGAPDTVAEGLEVLARVTGADELLLTTETHDPADTARSFELIAQAWGRVDAGARAPESVALA